MATTTTTAPARVEFNRAAYAQYDARTGERERRDLSASALCGCVGDRVVIARVKTARDDGRVTRVNLAFERARCFGRGAGVSGAPLGADGVYVEAAPRDVETRVTRSEWEEIFIRGLARVSDTTFKRGSFWHATSYLCGLACTALVCLPYFSRRYAEMWRAYDDALRAWMESANARLNPKGVYVKPQSNCWVWRNPGGGGKQRYIETWIAIAMDEAEIEALKREPFLFGDVANYSCYGGPDEREYITHPTF